MEAKYQLQKTELEIRDFSPDFKGQAISMRFSKHESIAYERLRKVVSGTLSAIGAQRLSLAQLQFILSDLRQTVGLAFNIPVNKVIDFHFHPEAGTVYTLPGDLMFFVGDLAEICKREASAH